MRVAYFSPMPPEQSGIADYSALLLPALRERIDVEVVRRGRKRAPRGTDVALYHVGNNPDAHAWIVDALRYTPHPSHFSVSDALAWIERIKPKRAILTNMHTDLDYEALRARLPPHVEPGFDGMRVEVRALE